MKTYIVLFLSTMICISCAQHHQSLSGVTDFQRKMNSMFQDATQSPLKEKDRKKFKGLDFFPFDSTYVIKAVLRTTPDEVVFKMKATTHRRPEYVKYGEVTFDLHGTSYQLNIYQNQELIRERIHANHLFLPFLDDTNGETTYGGGRYIDLKIPEADEVIIDFNTAYNPYCAYNASYSCPIVPRENYIATEIKAGVKAFDKD